MDKKIIQFHVFTNGGHVPMKVTPGSAGYDFWLSCAITFRTKTITRVAMGVKVIIPAGYIGVIHSKSGLAMEGIIAVTGVIDEDYQGEIRLLMHNMTEANYNVLKENPIAQMVVYHTDKLSTTYHTSDCIPPRINLQVTRGDKGFGGVTNLFQAQLTDDLSDVKILCSGARAHELWQTPTKPINGDCYLVQSTVSVTTDQPDTTPSAPWKKKPKKAPKPMMGVASTKGGTKVCHFPQSTKSMVSVTKALFKDAKDLSTDSNDVHFCETPTVSTLSVHGDWNGGCLTRMNVTHKMEKHCKIADAENMHRVTHSVFKQTQRLHNNQQH